MSKPARSNWGQLHAAISRCCVAWGDGQDHHRACVDDIRSEYQPDLEAYIQVFNASAEAAEAARAKGRAAA